MSEIALSFYGINQEEIIESGEIRRFEIEAVQPFTTNKLKYPVKIYYQLFIQEGQDRIIVIDWNEMNRGSNNHFILLNTSWWIPNTYYIDVKYEYKGDTRKINNLIKFKVVSER